MWRPSEDFWSYFHAAASRRPWIVWVGSAISASAPSGIPLTDAIVGTLLEYLGECGGHGNRHGRLSTALKDFGSDGPHDLVHKVRVPEALPAWRMPFEAVLGEVSGHAGGLVRAFLTALIPSRLHAQPNPNHQAVVELARKNLVDVVVTTNFDECFEPIWPWPVIVPTEGAFTAPGGQPILVKLHGTIGDFPSVAVNPDALARRARPDWQESVESLLRDRDVLFVGYGFQDRFDITPALSLAVRSGARFHWANKWEGSQPSRHLPMGDVTPVPTELSDPRRNILLELAGLDATDDMTRFPSEDEQKRRAEEALRDAGKVHAPSFTERLKAFGSLYYWLEDGRNALACFREARAVDEKSVDTHTLARGLLRARRYRRAVSLFKRMLARELPENRERQVAASVDWYCGAAHCAAAGGRPELAERLYRRATSDLHDAGKSEEDLPPYLMDQILRGRAGNQVRLAVQTWGSEQRDVRLAQAERDLNVLLSKRDSLELRVRYLVKRDLARIEMIRGNSAAAIESLMEVKEFFEFWGDPDGLATTNRDIAVARKVGRFSALAIDAAEARRRGRWLEWLKIEATRVGLTGYGPLAPIQRPIRNCAIATWDTLKELGLCATERLRGEPPL